MAQTTCATLAWSSHLPSEMVFESLDGEVFRVNFDGMSYEGMLVYRKILDRGMKVCSEIKGQILKGCFFVGIDFNISSFACSA